MKTKRKSLRSEAVHFPAQNLVKTKKKKGLHSNLVRFLAQNKSQIQKDVPPQKFL